MKKKIDKTLLTYMALGIANFLVCNAAMLWVYNHTDAGEDLSFLVYYALSTAISLVLNRYITFRNQHPTRSWPIKFILTVIICYLTTKVVLKWVIDTFLGLPFIQLWLMRLVHTMHPKQLEKNISLVICSFSYCALNYFGQRYFVFNDKEKVK